MTTTLVRCSRWLSGFKNSPFSKNQLAASFTSSSLTKTSDAKKPILQPGPPPIRVALTESAGRGVFATRRIGAGELIHTAKPLVSHPSLSTINTVCYFCLKKLGTSPAFPGQGPGFCCLECRDSAKVFYDVERKADWSAFDDYCRAQGLKFPLLVKRLACMVISGAASAETLDILQPAGLSHEMVLEMEESFGLLRNGFAKAGIVDAEMALLTKQWYIGVLARIRINAFRIELAGGLYEDLLSSAAACIESEAAVGNAVYMLPSFYNHDCDPNAHIIWVENADARLKALRDVEPDEELRICYIDASMEHEARKILLSQGFGFNCSCLRCLSGD